MASQISAFHMFTIITILISSTSIEVTSGVKYKLGRTINPKALGLGHEKLTHFRFFSHDSTNSTLTILEPRESTNTTFGFINMLDDPLTLGPKLGSKLVARAQGFYASASLGEFALMMHMNIVFVENKYNGSTITVAGRNPVFSTVRKLAVVGGTGVFRFARGFACVTTHFYTLDVEVDEFNIYIVHY